MSLLDSISSALLSFQNAWSTETATFSLANPPTEISFTYDHEGQRVSLSDGTTTTIYPNKLYNTDGTKTTKHIFDHEGNTIATIETKAGVSTTYYNHPDHLTGSNVVTNSTPALEQLIDYYPFGGIRLNEQSGTFDEQRKFTGHEYDDDTGLSYMVARYYDGDVGRFQSQDPVFLVLEFDLSDPQSLNAYAYSRNNPLRYVDPNGEDFIDVIQGLGAGLFQSGAGTVQFFGTVVTDPGAAIQGLGATFSYAGSQINAIASDSGSYFSDVNYTITNASDYELGFLAGNTAGDISQVLVGAKLVPKGKATASDSIPARGPQSSFTQAERAKINEIGQNKGCHTCGTKDPGTKSGNFVPDHNPPSALNPNNGPQTLAPQCINCSRQQGGQVSQTLRKQKEQ